MSLIPVGGSFVAGAGSNASRGTLFEDWLASNKMLPGAAPGNYVIIAGGELTVTNGVCQMDTDGSSPVNLDAINSYGLQEGMMLLIGSSDASRKINVRHNAVNIVLNTGADFLLEDSTMKLYLQLRAGIWYEMFRSYGSNQAAWRNSMGLASGATATLASDAEAVAGTNPSKYIVPSTLKAALDSSARMIDNKTLTAGRSPSDNFLVARDGVLYKMNILTLYEPSFANYIVTGEYGVGDNDNAVAAHGLGGEPKLVRGYLRCKTAELGMNVGMEVPLECFVNDGLARHINYGADSVNFWMRCTNGAATAPKLINRSGGAVTVITANNWRFFMRLWR